MPTPSHRPAARKTRSSPSAAREARRPLTPDSWIDAATEVLVDHGIDHVRVDVLAHQLGVTRGSFYWHFRDRDDLLQRVLKAWSERMTEQVTRRLQEAETDPRLRIRNLMSLPLRGRSAVRAARIELAIRTWARHDPAAKAAVVASDARRIAFHKRLFIALGFPAAEAGHRAFLLYGYEIAESLLTHGSASRRKARAAVIERLILKPEG